MKGICFCPATWKRIRVILNKTKTGKQVIRIINAAQSRKPAKSKRKTKQKSRARSRNSSKKKGSQKGKKKVTWVIKKGKNKGKRVTFWVKK